MTFTFLDTIVSNVTDMIGYIVGLLPGVIIAGLTITGLVYGFNLIKKAIQKNQG